jgi:NTP pyrophosphatase (non-canonical NTP hydrolase)
MDPFSKQQMARLTRSILDGCQNLKDNCVEFINNSVFKTNFEKVSNFNNVAGVTKLENITPVIVESNKELVNQMYSLIDEETKELREAIDNNDVVEIRDALADILYVTYGMGFRLGIKMDPDFEIVHSSNMSKFCTTENEAKQTVEKYLNKYTAGDSTYDSPYYEKNPNNNLWVIRNRSTGKVLKNINYTPVKWNS